MAAPGIAVKASRFALLKVEDDDDEVEADTKSKHQGGNKGNQQTSGNKKKNKKKKHKEASSENAEVGPQLSASQWVWKAWPNISQSHSLLKLTSLKYVLNISVNPPSLYSRVDPVNW